MKSCIHAFRLKLTDRHACIWTSNTHACKLFGLICAAKDCDRSLSTNLVVENGKKYEVKAHYVVFKCFF